MMVRQQKEHASFFAALCSVIGKPLIEFNKSSQLGSTSVPIQKYAASMGVTEEKNEILASLEIPSRILSRIMKLDDWEFAVAALCKAFIFYSGKEEYAAEAKTAASEIGKIIVDQLLKGNYSGPKIVSDGLQNIKAGKPFRPEAGKQPSPSLTIDVVVAFYLFKKMRGYEPTQKVVLEILRTAGFPYPSGTISKVFTKLNLPKKEVNASGIPITG